MINTFDCKRIDKPTQSVLSLISPKRTANVFKTEDHNGQWFIVEVLHKGIYHGLTTWNTAEQAKAYAEKWQAFN